MKKKISHAQLVECVYRSFHGQSNKEIARHFDVTPHALSNIKKRRKHEWDSITAQLVREHIQKLLKSQTVPASVSEAQKRANALLLREIPNLTSQAGAIQRIIDAMGCSYEDAEKYIARFQEQLQVTLFHETQF